MTIPMISVADLNAILPEIFICCSAFALLMLDLFIDAKRRPLIHFLAIAVLVAAILLTVRFRSGRWQNAVRSTHAHAVDPEPS